MSHKWMMIIPMILALLLTACGNAETTDDSNTTSSSDSAAAPSEEGINVTVTGDVEVNIEDGTWISSQDDGAIVMVFMQSMASMTTNASIYDVPYPDSVPVTYDLTSASIETEGVEAWFEFENTRYEDNVSGSITINTFDETMSGTYNFTAERTDDAGETVSVTVEGSFSDVPVPEQSE